MKVLQALQAVRAELSQMTLKKSGHNKFSGFDYFELSDFLPTVQQLCAKHGICPVFILNGGNAILTIHSYEDDSSIMFEIPAATVEMKGANAIQCLGAEITYLRRYCYMAAFEISECDTVDCMEQDKAKRNPREEKPSGSLASAKKTMKMAWDMAISAGVDSDHLKAIASDINPQPSKDWSAEDCIKFSEEVHKLL